MFSLVLASQIGGFLLFVYEVITSIFQRLVSCVSTYPTRRFPLRLVVLRKGSAGSHVDFFRAETKFEDHFFAQPSRTNFSEFGQVAPAFSQP